MNKLPADKRVQILSLLCEGTSMRAVSRLADVSINTVSGLLVSAGTVCAAFHNETVRGLKCKRVQCDEIWSFVGAKAKNVTPEQKAQGWGDCWTWTAIDADTKLIASWFIGTRDALSAWWFMRDLCSRVITRVQLTTDGHHVYPAAVEEAFADLIDYAQLVKIYGSPREGAARYSPADILGTRSEVIIGNPDPKHISTSYVERQNLTMRMHMRRFTRLTNGFSKKIENHAHMVALYTVFYNWTKVHKTLRVTPAMAAGLADRVFDMADVVALIEHAEAPVPAMLSERDSA